MASCDSSHAMNVFDRGGENEQSACLWLYDMIDIFIHEDEGTIIEVRVEV